MTEANSNNREEVVTKKGDWVTYRPEIRILDCTIRDGGLMNNHYFEDDFVKAVYDANIAAGVDYMELGYKADQKIFSRDEAGPWKFCTEEDMRRVVGDNDSALKLSVMADAERVDYKKDILPCKDSVLDVIRVACYIHQMSTALDMIKDAKDKGYEVTLNLMAISVVPEHELDDGLAVLMKSDVDTVYLVDSFGAFYQEQIQHLIQKYIDAAEETGKDIGIHTHNNQQLAYANTIEAIMLGVNRIDATYMGMGRGAGNCPLELLIGFLHNPKFKLRPVLKAIDELFVPLSEKVDWGYALPYMITGQLNEHPRPALAHMKSEDKDKVVAFYDSMIQETS